MAVEITRDSRNRRVIQFYRNLDDILGGYENGRMDDPETYVDMTEDEWVEYVMCDIYNMKASGYGSCWYSTGICKDLKFLGKANMREAILKEVYAEGWVCE